MSLPTTELLEHYRRWRETLHPTERFDTTETLSCSLRTGRPTLDFCAGVPYPLALQKTPMKVKLETRSFTSDNSYVERHFND